MLYRKPLKKIRQKNHHMMQEILLSAKGLSRSFDNTKAIKDINFEIHRGEVVALLGPNGAGKSTTLNIITGNLYPHSGEVKHL